MTAALWVLGVDPGAISGWALVNPDGFPQCFGQTGAKGRAMTGLDVFDVLEECGPEVGFGDWPPVLAVEGQFLKRAVNEGGRDRFLGVSTLETSRYRGAWLGVCARYALPVFKHKGKQAIPSNVWRASQWGGTWSTEAAKVHAVNQAEQRFGVTLPITHHHTAEAIFIARHAQHELGSRAAQLTLTEG
jgi:hypothetical protein